MPEASINKDGNLESCERDIGSPAISPYWKVDSKAESLRVKSPPDQQLGLRVPPLVCDHGSSDRISRSPRVHTTTVSG